MKCIPNVISPISSDLTDSWQRLRTEMESVGPDVTAHKRRIWSLLSCAMIQANNLPAKLNPVIRPLMDTLQHEPVLALVKLTAEHAAKLLKVAHVSCCCCCC